MRFLCDQDIYASTSRLLTSLGHDVATASAIGLAQAEDARLLQVAQEQNRIFVTRDRDFGALVFVQSSGAGVLYLRTKPSTESAIHVELQRVLTLYREEELRAAFVVIEPGRHRIRTLRSGTATPENDQGD